MSDEAKKGPWDFAIAVVKNWWVWVVALIVFGFANIETGTDAAVRVITAFKGCP